eukprot:tig00021275_g19878.t1
MHAWRTEQAPIHEILSFAAEGSEQRVFKAQRGDLSALTRAWYEAPEPPPADFEVASVPWSDDAELPAERRESRALEANMMSVLDRVGAVMERLQLENDPLECEEELDRLEPPSPDAVVPAPPPGEGPGPFTRQRVPAPYLLESRAEGDALMAAAEAAAEALGANLRYPGSPQSPESPFSSVGSEASEGAGAGRAALAARLAAALCDARLLGTRLVASIPGRQRFRSMLAALRTAGRPGLAAGVVGALVAALQQPPVRQWGERDAEAMVDHATALLLALTAEAPRTAPDLFALSWEQAQRLAGRVQLLGGEFPAVRPKALVFCAMALDRYDKTTEAIGLYFEAWAELVKRQMTPGPLEAALIPALADLHFAQGQGRMGLHIADKAYHLQGSGPPALYSQYLVLHVKMIACRWRNDSEGALAASEKALEVLERLGGANGYALPLCRMLHCHAVNCMVAGRFRGRPALKALTRTVHILHTLQDPSSCELDFIPDHYSEAARRRVRPRDRARNFAILARVVAVRCPRPRPRPAPRRPAPPPRPASQERAAKEGERL